MWRQLAEVGFQVKMSLVDNATMHTRRQAFEYDLTFFATKGRPMIRTARSVLLG
jgi:nickel transport system substrate-binding protein